MKTTGHGIMFTLCAALGMGTASATTSLFNPAAFTPGIQGPSLSGSITWNDANNDGFVTDTEISAWSFTVTDLFGANAYSSSNSGAFVESTGRGFYIVPSSSGDLSFALPVPSTSPDRVFFGPSQTLGYVDFLSAVGVSAITPPRIFTQTTSLLVYQFNATSRVLDPIVFTGVSPIPEPENWALMGAGLAALAGLRSWKTRRRIASAH